MNPFNPLSIVQSTFESDDVQHELKELVEIIRAYDIYDFLRRLSALNLQKENQNRAVLLDALQSAILYNDETYYTSSAKMSASKFSSIIKKLDSISLVHAIDPNENVFTQNVMLYDNYTVFNGIDSYPAYRLQMLCEIFFGFKNSFPLEYIKKVYFLFSAMLKISTHIAKSIGISSEPPIIETASTKVPSNETLSYHSKLISISRNNMLRMLNNDVDMLDIIAIPFGTHAWGSIDTRPFYTKPFLYDAGSDSYILLNVALLPEFMSFMTLKIADTFKIKDAVVDMYNSRIWYDCKKSLAKLGHRKIKESSLHIELLDTNYYKEILLNVFNNQLMVVSFICDDALGYSADNMHDTYAPSKYTNAITKREDYFAKKFKDNHILPQNVFHLVILNGIGRAVSCSLENVFSDYGIVHLNPFELHCISINEMKHTGFLPRYFVAKSSVKTLTSGLFSELNCITIYTDNQYSFYLSDDASPDNPLMLITPGDAPYYIGKALLAEDATLIKSYDDKTKIPVVLSDVKRKIYFDENFATKNVLSFCIRFSDVIIWLTSDVNFISDVPDVNVIQSLMDMTSYWLSESREIIEHMDLMYSIYHFSLCFEKNSTTGNNAKTLDEYVTISGGPTHYTVTFSELSLIPFNCETNRVEKEYITLFLDYLSKTSSIAITYNSIIERIFSPSYKKKIVSFDIQREKYLTPVLFPQNTAIRPEDEDRLSSLIGQQAVESHRWNYGPVSNSDGEDIVFFCVNTLYDMLKREVSEWSPVGLLEKIYSDLEEVISSEYSQYDRYRYDVTCYPEKEDEYLKQLNDVNRLSMALKFLAEYVTATPPSGETPIGLGRYEFVLAICVQIIEWAYRKDLLHYKMMNLPISILKSNRIGINEAELVRMGQYGSRYRKEQLAYSSASFPSSSESNDYSQALDEAFLSAYSYSHTQLAVFIHLLIDFGEEHLQGEVVITTKDELLGYLYERDNEFTSEISTRILKDITLTAREDFMKAPAGFRKEDVYPWRFNRQYSFIRRPILCRGNDLIWGIRQLYHSLLYVTNLIYGGRLATTDKKMNTLMGRICNDQGDAFNQHISDIVKSFGVFKVFPNVKRINKKKIADEKGDVLGDIDVLIIDEKKHRIVVAEVKNFDFSKNPYEIHAEYQKMFLDGKKKSFATKHKRRVEWVIAHFDDVRAQYSLSRNKWTVHGVFITNEPLMSVNTYRKKLSVLSEAELSVESLRKIQ